MSLYHLSLSCFGPCHLEDLFPHLGDLLAITDSVALLLFLASVRKPHAYSLLKYLTKSGARQIQPDTDLLCLLEGKLSLDLTDVWMEEMQG